MMVQQQQAAITAQQEQQRQAAIDQQRHAEAERRAAVARAEQAQRQAEAEAAQARRRAEEETARRAAAQLAAENSPDNYCRDRSFAREIMKTFNNVGEKRGFEAIDIEHVTTTSFDASEHSVSCHGDFMLANGRRLTGTLSIQPNVAGDMLTRWRAD
jgi:uncharacterized membrane protein YqiK